MHDNTGQCRTMWDHAVLCGTMRDQAGPYGTKWDHVVPAEPCGTKWDHVGQNGTIQDQMGPYGTRICFMCSGCGSYMNSGCVSYRWKPTATGFDSFMSFEANWYRMWLLYRVSLKTVNAFYFAISWLIFDIF